MLIYFIFSTQVKKCTWHYWLLLYIQIPVERWPFLWRSPGTYRILVLCLVKICWDVLTMDFFNSHFSNLVLLNVKKYTPQNVYLHIYMFSNIKRKSIIFGNKIGKSFSQVTDVLITHKWWIYIRSSLMSENIFDFTLPTSYTLFIRTT